MPAKLKLESIEKDGTLLDHATLWAAEDIMDNGPSISSENKVRLKVCAIFSSWRRRDKNMFKAI